MATTKINLSSLVRIDDLRTVWANEASNFTKWLAEEDNLELLGDTLGINLIPKETESNVGDFRADILCTEEGTENVVVIENQLEQTDHNHLGQILTYAAGKDARIIIWIVKTAREEHAKAIEWLNGKIPDVDFFLIEIELWKIDDSGIAPKFNIVEKPNGWGKQQKIEEGLSDRERLITRFWERFNDLANADAGFKASGFHTTKAWKQSFYNLRFGRGSVGIELTFRTWKKEVGAAIYIQNNKEVYQLFEQNKDKVHSILGTKAAWKMATKDGTIRITKQSDVNKESNWDGCIKWLLAQSSKLKDAVDAVMD